MSGTTKHVAYTRYFGGDVKGGPESHVILVTSGCDAVQVWKTPLSHKGKDCSVLFAITCMSLHTRTLKKSQKVDFRHGT